MHYLDIELEGVDENGEKKLYLLKDFNGEKIILYFYPEDDTPVCTKEAQLFRDNLIELNKYAKIIGVSRNDIEDHIEFQEKHNLKFILLSDNKKGLKNAFKEHLTNSSDIHRSTFILDEEGNIIKSWEKVDVDDHIENIFAFFNKNLDKSQNKNQNTLT